MFDWLREYFKRFYKMVNSYINNFKELLESNPFIAISSVPATFITILFIFIAIWLNL